ncbi:hypothetical protein FRC04_008031 [Tulasnella sp. 424]|nr:hypothetical protein FRC04_008031 [Tulasnella sp. 424]KAG8959351.1 hypothetical protein FRC05_007899 [Tulasnella sp. 425]
MIMSAPGSNNDFMEIDPFENPDHVDNPANDPATDNQAEILNDNISAIEDDLISILSDAPAAPAPAPAPAAAATPPTISVNVCAHGRASVLLLAAILAGVATLFFVHDVASLVKTHKDVQVLKLRELRAWTNTIEAHVDVSTPGTSVLESLLVVLEVLLFLYIAWRV